MKLTEMLLEKPPDSYFKIVRPFWNKGFYVALFTNEDGEADLAMFQDGVRRLWYKKLYDILADDWEFYEERNQCTFNSEGQRCIEYGEVKIDGDWYCWEHNPKEKYPTCKSSDSLEKAYTKATVEYKKHAYNSLMKHLDDCHECTCNETNKDLIHMPTPVGGLTLCGLGTVLGVKLTSGDDNVTCAKCSKKINRPDRPDIDNPRRYA